jgi:transmembrane sensor
MNAGTLHKDEPIPADRLAEAGVWIARLHGDDRNSAVEAGFRQWLEAHPLNARAFELSTEVWEDSQNLRRVVPFAHDVPKARPRRFRFPFPVVAAIATLAVVAMVVLIAEVLHFRHEGVATGVGEQRLLTLEDGSRVFLNTATRIVVHFDKAARRVELEAGEALFDVAKHPGRPFIVEAGDRQVTALGTSFAIRRDRDRTAVTLVEGRIAVTPVRQDLSAGSSEMSEPARTAARQESQVRASGARDAFTLTPGQRLTIAGNQPAEVDTPSLDKTLAWRRGQVVLDDTPLTAAVSEMNRYNAVKLTIEGPEAAALVVSGLFQAGDSMSFANVIARAYGLRVLERGDEIVLAGVPTPRQ